MSAVPTIETERLILRGHRVDDLDPYAQLWSDARVTRFIGGQPLDREQAWARILRYRGMWALLGFGFWVIEERSSGKLIGETGFQEIERAIEPPLRETLETGWVLAPQAQGKGYAREAVGAALGWADRHFPGRTLSCIIVPENRRSLALAARFGFDEFARTTYHGAEVVLLRK